MAIDTLLWEDYKYWLDRPLIRFYGWEPFTVSLGYSQNISDIATDLIRQDGYDIVRRPTGGKAIFHAGELTYAVIIPASVLNREELYAKVNYWFSMLLQNYGIQAMQESEQPDFRKAYKEPGSAPCFSSTARYEIKVSNRKIVGSAQRVGAETILQHGSFMINNEHLKLVSYMSTHKISKTETLNRLKRQATELNDHSSRSFTPEEVAVDFQSIMVKDGIQLSAYSRFSEMEGSAAAIMDKFEICREVVL